MLNIINNDDKKELETSSDSKKNQSNLCYVEVRNSLWDFFSLALSLSARGSSRHSSQYVIVANSLFLFFQFHQP